MPQFSAPYGTFLSKQGTSSHSNQDIYAQVATSSASVPLIAGPRWIKSPSPCRGKVVVDERIGAIHVASDLDLAFPHAPKLGATCFCPVSVSPVVRLVVRSQDCLVSVDAHGFSSPDCNVLSCGILSSSDNSFSMRAQP